MRRWHGGSVLAAVALTRGGNVTIPVDGGPRPALALVDGDDVCAAVRAYCDGTPFKSTGLLKDASWSVTTGDGVGLPGADGCVRALAEAVQPRLERDWPATRARFAVRDDYLAGCVAADFGLDAEGPDDPLFALLAEAVAARDAASPALAEYNRRRTLLPPARRARHYRDVCLKLLPAHPGALDSLAVALRHAGRARAAELVRDGADLHRWSRAPVPDSISAQVLARGAGRGLWPSPYQRPAHHAANLTARPLWAAGALPGLERLARRTAAFGRELAVELARRADALVVRQAEGLARRLPGAPGDDWGWDEVALLKHGEVPDARVAARFAETLAAVRAAGAFFNAKFSILQPGTEILPHCGPSNARLRAHVTVAAAAGASLRVGAPDAKRVEWGAAPLVFDDSFEHDVIHEGADPRIVLVLDAWHPELPPERRRFELYGRLS